jgi:hypothetical protein
MKTKETYIANGKRFNSYDEVIDYCKEHNYRVTNTTTIRKNTFLIDLTSL